MRPFAVVLTAMVTVFVSLAWGSPDGQIQNLEPHTTEPQPQQTQLQTDHSSISLNSVMLTRTKYKNDLYGFELEYPSALEELPGVDITKPHDLYLLLPPAPMEKEAAHASLSFEVDSNSHNIPLATYYKKFFRSGAPEFTPAEDIVNITFQGKPAVDFKSHYNRSQSGDSYYVSEKIIIPMDLWFIHIDINDYANAFNDFQPNTIPSILASFHFIEPRASTLLRMPACDAKNLKTNPLGFEQYHTGSASGTISIINIGSTTCTLQESPKYRLLGASGNLLSIEYSEVNHGDKDIPEKIWLEPQEESSLGVNFGNVCPTKKAAPLFLLLKLPNSGNLKVKIDDDYSYLCSDPTRPAFLSVDSFIK